MNDKTNLTCGCALLASVDDCNENAFSTLYKIYYKPLRHIAYGILKDTDLASDAVHNVMVRIWRSGKVSGISNLEFYLKRSVRNESLRIRQKEAKRTGLFSDPSYEVESNGTCGYAPIYEKETQQQFLAAFRCLSHRQRQAYYFCKLQGMTCKEAGKKLNLSHYTVNEYVQLASKKVHTLMGMAA